MVDLNTLISPSSGWTLTAAGGMNDLGEIAGYGTIGGVTHAFLLTPVPEPSTACSNGDGDRRGALLSFAQRTRVNEKPSSNGLADESPRLDLASTSFVGHVLTAEP